MKTLHKAFGLPTILLLATVVAGCGQDTSGNSGTTTDSGGTTATDLGKTFGQSDTGTEDTGTASNEDTGGSGGAIDTGSAAKDTGSSAVDSGTSGLVDAGTAKPIDAGTPDPVDAGQVGPIDAGSGPIDAGSPTTIDAGSAPIDAGMPQVDAGTPSADAGGSNKKLVRFAALGDTGTGSEKQYKTGKALAKHCKDKGCDFVLLLGDNFYDVGVSSENDKQFKTKFEDPYKDVKAPFFVTLGNHDYGGGGTGGEFMKKEHYLKYAKKNPKFVLPKPYWHKQIGHVHLFSMDSNAMMFADLFKGLDAAQVKVMKPAIANSKADWKITFAHHPYRSNGPHGNAGCYEGAKLFTPLLCGTIPVVSGKGVKSAFDDMICGKSDVHFSGHDHSFQWLKKSASTKHCKNVELIVAGSGAKYSKLYSKDTGGLKVNPWHYQNVTVPGFLWVEIKGNTFYGEFIDMNGKKLYSRSFTK